MAPTEEGTTRPRATLRLRLRSDDPNAVPPRSLIADAERAMREFAERPEVERVEVQRSKSMPIGVDDAIVIVSIYVAMRVADKVIDNLADDAYAYLKKKLGEARGSVEREPGGDDEPGQQAGN